MNRMKRHCSIYSKKCGADKPTYRRALKNVIRLKANEISYSRNARSAVASGKRKMDRRGLGPRTAQKGSVRMIFFAPRKIDHQTSHDEDEYYFIVKGKGELVIDDERFSFATGDA